MARSKETFGKKELEKKKLKKRKEKEARKEERKANGGGKSFEDMLVYVDENGQLTSTPPDPTKKTEVDADSIVLGARNSNAGYVEDPLRKGTVTFFNTSKGYGFIKDSETGESIFVHINGLVDQVNENDKVNFETERGPKGMNAVNVTLKK
ncbi:cold shock domain-containing protein [Labilibaculum sp. DW002]|uniref:Cold shock domain-containing protein n=1 Tax=Paralabilibaculum antarcticum TaxID=2912572 RepID=A0ABT5VUG8_9BACT|nr:cold shock domain-containing protein [Labilibaculum sp. DW002]MDE5418967.1 cold shock domain-containing protein [Labilibaculum sp. DW002]